MEELRPHPTIGMRVEGERLGGNGNEVCRSRITFFSISFFLLVTLLTQANERSVSLSLKNDTMENQAGRMGKAELGVVFFFPLFLSYL